MIEFQNIVKTYYLGKHEVHALNGVNFKIDSGEMVSIMGASGSGKTTAMNILGLLDRPTAGKYYLNGQEVSTLARDQLAQIRNEIIGFIFQQFFLLPRLSALRNVGLPLTYQGVDAAEIKTRSYASLEKVGMANHIDHRPNELSGGQQQRVAIARALVTDPKVILADEPTGSLDSKTGQDVMNLLIDINKKEQATIVVVTHDINVAKQCSRIIRLRDGNILEE